MNSLNVSVLLGHLTSDPELRSFASGTVLTTMTVACNRRYKDLEGQLKEESVFLPIQLWGRQGQWAAEHRTGELVLVWGRLKTDQWTKEGVTHSRIVMVAEGCQFLRAPERRANSAPVATAEDNAGDRPPF